MSLLKLVDLNLLDEFLTKVKEIIPSQNATASAAGLMSASDKAKLDAEILVFDLGSISSLPQTVSNSLITANHILLRAELGNPAAQKSNWTVETSSGSALISGTISRATTLKIVLGIPSN